jgi:predicted transcriptional regulator YheO
MLKPQFLSFLENALKNEIINKNGTSNSENFSISSKIFSLSEFSICERIQSKSLSKNNRERERERGVDSLNSEGSLSCNRQHCEILKLIEPSAPSVFSYERQ